MVFRERVWSQFVTLLQIHLGARFQNENDGLDGEVLEFRMRQGESFCKQIHSLSDLASLATLLSLESWSSFSLDLGQEVGMNR